MAVEKSFAEATAVTRITAHEYSADFPSDWCIGFVPHGGYVTSVFLQVASAHFASTLSSQNQPHTIALHLSFLRRTQVGPAYFTVKDVKLGRQTSVVHITLTQNGREEVVGYLTNSNITSESGVTFPTSFTLHPPPLPVDLKLLGEDQDQNWARKTSMPYDNLRKATKKLQFHFPRGGQQSKSTADEWVRLAPSSDRWTNSSLGFVCDAWPLPVDAYIHDSNPYSTEPQSISESGGKKSAKLWYPTLLLNLDIKKALPEEGVEWLFVRVDTKVIKNGRMDLEVIICDENNEVVAVSNQIAFAVDIDRNSAGRNTNSKI